MVTIPSTIMPPPTCDNYKAKGAFLGHAWPNRNFDSWPLTSKFDAFIPAPISINAESLSRNTQDIVIKIFILDSRTRARTHENSGSLRPLRWQRQKNNAPWKKINAHIRKFWLFVQARTVHRWLTWFQRHSQCTPVGWRHSRHRCKKNVSEKISKTL